MKRIKVWQALRNSDLTEGRGIMLTVGYFEHKQDAEKAIRGMGVMGVGNGEAKEYEIVIFESFLEYSEERMTKDRKSALLKLTRDEKLALGVL